MKNLFALLALMMPVLVSAQDKLPVQANEKNTNNPYRVLATELSSNYNGLNKKVAVAGFSYTDGRDSRDGSVLSERLTTELIKLKKFKVIERKEIQEVLKELKFQYSGAISSDSAKEIGKMLGADLLLVGTITELPDNQLDLNSRLVEVESGEILAAGNALVVKDWLDKYRKLLEEQDNVIEKNTKDSKAFYAKGWLYIDLGEYDNAVGSFDIALTLAPTYSEALFGRSYAYEKKGEYDKAITDCSKLLDDNPREAALYYVRGTSYYGKGEYNKAIADYSNAIIIEPQDAGTYGARGFAYNRIQAYDKAIADFSKAIAISGQNSGAFYGRGLAYEGIGDYDRAIEEYSKGISITPRLAAAYHNRGNAYTRKGQYDKAIADYSKTLTIDTENAKVYTYSDRGFAYYSKKEYAKAIQDYSKAIALNPKYAMAYGGRALVYRAEGEAEKALRDCNTAMDLNPELRVQMQGIIDSIKGANNLP